MPKWLESGDVSESKTVKTLQLYATSRCTSLSTRLSSVMEPVKKKTLVSLGLQFSSVDVQHFAPVLTLVGVQPFARVHFSDSICRAAAGLHFIQ